MDKVLAGPIFAPESTAAKAVVIIFFRPGN